MLSYKAVERERVERERVGGGGGEVGREEGKGRKEWEEGAVRRGRGG